MPISSVRDVAKVVLQQSEAPVSNLKLQKLLYYVQGWSLAVNDKPAFEGRIEAWVHGPVVPEVFYAYRGYRWNPIEVPSEAVMIPEEEVTHVRNVLAIHGQYSATQLEEASHKESPWLNARGTSDPKALSNAVITHEEMKAFFTARLNA